MFGSTVQVADQQEEVDQRRLLVLVSTANSLNGSKVYQHTVRGKKVPVQAD